ncbi:hypothetical protein D9M72_104130 [compost metagenome]
MALARAQDLDGASPAIVAGRPAADHQRGAAIGDQAAIQQTQRRTDFTGVQHVVDGDRFALVRLGMAAGVAAVFHRDGGQVFRADAELVHVALGDERVGCRHADTEGALELRMADLGQGRHRAVSGQPGQAVVARHDQHVVALAAGHERGRLHDHDAGAGAAGLDGGAEIRAQAGVLAEDGTQHQVGFRKGIGAQHAVDMAGLQPRVADGAERRFGVQAHATGAGQFADARVAGAGDIRVHAHAAPSFPDLAGQANASGCLSRKRATASSW